MLKDVKTLKAEQKRREMRRKRFLEKKKHIPKVKTYKDRMADLGFMRCNDQLFLRGDISMRYEKVNGEYKWQLRDSGTLIYADDNVTEVIVYLEDYYG